MNSDFGRSRAQSNDGALEIGGQAMGVAQGELFVYLQMQLDEKPVILLERREIMNGQAAPLRFGANGLEEMLALRRTRLGVNHHVGRNDLADALFDGVT